MRTGFLVINAVLLDINRLDPGFFSQVDELDVRVVEVGLGEKAHHRRRVVLFVRRGGSSVAMEHGFPNYHRLLRNARIPCLFNVHASGAETSGVTAALKEGRLGRMQR